MKAIRPILNSATFVACLYAGAAHAQDNACSVIKKWGIYDTSENQTDEARALSLRNHFCSSSIETEEEYKSWSGGVDVDVIGWGGGSGSSKNDSRSFRERKQEFCSDSNYQSKFKNLTIQRVKKANPHVVAALASCTDSQRGSAVGKLIVGSDKYTFTLYFSYTPKGQGSPPLATMLQDVSLVSKNAKNEQVADCTSFLKKGQEFASQIFMSCRRQPSIIDPIEVHFSAKPESVWITPQEVPALDECFVASSATPKTKIYTHPAAIRDSTGWVSLLLPADSRGTVATITVQAWSTTDPVYVKSGEYEKPHDPENGPWVKVSSMRVNEAEAAPQSERTSDYKINPSVTAVYPVQLPCNASGRARFFVDDRKGNLDYRVILTY